MARGRNNNKLTKRNKTQPAVLTLTYIVPTGDSYIDLACSMSIANRRAYSQQFKPAVAGMTLYTEAAASGAFKTYVLPDTWVMDNAYTKTRALWNEMNDQVLDTETDIQGKYHDFKIAMDVGMTTATIQSAGNPAGTILTPADEFGNLTAADFVGGVAPVGDWDYSQLTIPNDPASGVTSEYFIHAVGADTAGSKGMIAGYELSRARPQNIDPSVPQQGWMTSLFDVGEQLDELRDNLEAQNDRAPYPVGANTGSTAFYPGGPNELPGLQAHDLALVTATTIGGKTQIPGCMPQCGLIKITNDTGQVANLQIHLMPGKHRGYLCEEM